MAAAQDLSPAPGLVSGAQFDELTTGNLTNSQGQFYHVKYFLSFYLKDLLDR
jgi:hypothetical protein